MYKIVNFQGHSNLKKFTEIYKTQVSEYVFKVFRSSALRIVLCFIANKHHRIVKQTNTKFHV